MLKEPYILNEVIIGLEKPIQCATSFQLIFSSPKSTKSFLFPKKQEFGGLGLHKNYHLH
jgi:hypothetical protein